MSILGRGGEFQFVGRERGPAVDRIQITMLISLWCLAARHASRGDWSGVDQGLLSVAMLLALLVFEKGQNQSAPSSEGEGERCPFVCAVCNRSFMGILLIPSLLLVTKMSGVRAVERPGQAPYAQRRSFVIQYSTRPFPLRRTPQ